MNRPAKKRRSVGGETAMAEDEQPAEDEPVAANSHTIAAE